MNSFKTFASQHLIFEKKIWHMNFLYDNFNKKILLNFHIKTVIQKFLCQKKVLINKSIIIKKIIYN